MAEIEPKRIRGWRWQNLTHSLSARLTVFLWLGLLATFAALGYLNVRLHRRNLEAATLTSAERVSDVIKRSANYQMLHNDRSGLYQMISTMADEPGMVRVRIFDKEGRISFSSDAAEMGSEVDKKAEACYGCHAQAQPLARLNRPDRFRIYHVNGARVLGVINPIENRNECSSAPCHAHPAEQQILGVLDTNLSLAQTDASLAASSRRMVAYTSVAMLMIAVFSGMFVWRVVGRPVKALRRGTEKLKQGDLGYQISSVNGDELGELANSFNQMSCQLRVANDDNAAWTHTLEARVDEKTLELKKTHEHMLHAEKLASVGKMAAVLAHEINNPLSGILTYAKLLGKWVQKEAGLSARRDEMVDALNLIATESRRCGELVKNLLMYSRTSPMNLQETDLSQVIERCRQLVQHKLDMVGIRMHVDAAAGTPLVSCDSNQIEQVLLALMLNAIDAMPQGGNLWVTTQADAENEKVSCTVRDDGAGIAPEMLAEIFEPFITTKQSGGTGLGLAISRSIVERHGGSIQVESKPGSGAAFIIRLPCSGAGKPVSLPASVSAPVNVR
jgi:two-component system, NtrC family, sensor kinase